jgi:hypothetical protein
MGCPCGRSTTPLDKKPVVLAAASGIARLAETKRFHLRPLGVRQNETVHPKLESQPTSDENPESQQTLDDGSKWQIFPGDLDVTLSWKPGTELKLVRLNDDPVSSHALISADDNRSVRSCRNSKDWSVGVAGRGKVAGR